MPAVITIYWSLLNEIYRGSLENVSLGALLPAIADAAVIIFLVSVVTKLTIYDISQLTYLVGVGKVGIYTLRSELAVMTDGNFIYSL